MKILTSIFLIAGMLYSTATFAAVKGEEIEYKSNGTTLKGYLAYDDSIEGKRPGVIVVHEWWGHNDYARKRADMLAELGYTAFAIDMYGDGKQADHPDDAGKFMAETLSNMPEAEKRFNAGVEVLKAQPTVNPDEIAAIGYCFGGAVVLHMASTGADLDGVASFHGAVSPGVFTEKGKTKAKVIMFQGGADPFVPEDKFTIFQKEMDDAGVDNEVIVYPGVQHSFTNPGATEVGKKFELPLVYDEDADKDSWEKFQVFLKTIFQPENN